MAGRTEGEESVAATTAGGGGEGERGCFPRDLLDNRDDLSESSDAHLGGEDDRGEEGGGEGSMTGVGEGSMTGAR